MREIQPTNNSGSIQLKFTVSGKRYSFNPIPGARFTDPQALATARAIATRISNDRLAGCFDPTLDRYRLEPKGSRQPPTDLLTLWDLWTTGLALPAATQADHYEMVRRQIAKATPGLLDTAWFTKCPLSAATYNKRRGMLAACLQWGVESGQATENPWVKVKPRKGDHRPETPFNPSEISEICRGFDDLAPGYSRLIRFLFLTGCRLSEGIGLQWLHIDLARGTLTIAESLSIDRTGNGYRRLRKSTKTGSIRQLPLNPQLRAVLGPASSPTALVFTSPQGHAIASSNLWRAWAKVLKARVIPHRRLHNIRHTVLSMAVEQGTPLTGVAYLAGHSDSRMVLKTYGHVINQPQLPTIELPTQKPPTNNG